MVNAVYHRSYEEREPIEVRISHLAYAPEIRAAALVGGGARLVEVLLHQQAKALVRSLKDGLRRTDAYRLILPVD